MPLVTNIATDPTGTAAPNASVTVRLVASSTGEAPGYTSSSTVFGRWTTRAGDDGSWSVNLTANTQLQPANTYYEITETPVSGRHGVTSRVVVPAGGGPYALRDILLNGAAALPLWPLDAHLADAADAHDASAVSVTPTGTIAATDVQAALAELDSEKTRKFWVDARDYGLVGDGVTDDHDAICLAAQAAWETNRPLALIANGSITNTLGILVGRQINWSIWPNLAVIGMYSMIGAQYAIAPRIRMTGATALRSAGAAPMNYVTQVREKSVTAPASHAIGTVIINGTGLNLRATADPLNGLPADVGRRVRVYPTGAGTAQTYTIASVVDANTFTISPVSGVAVGLTVAITAGVSLIEVQPGNSACYNSFENIDFVNAWCPFKVFETNMIRFTNCGFRASNDSTNTYGDNTGLVISDTFWTFFNDCQFYSPGRDKGSVIWRGGEAANAGLSASGGNVGYLAYFRNCEFQTDGVYYEQVAATTGPLPGYAGFYECHSEAFGGSAALLRIKNRIGAAITFTNVNFVGCYHADLTEGNNVPYVYVDTGRGAYGAVDTLDVSFWNCFANGTAPLIGFDTDNAASEGLRCAAIGTDEGNPVAGYLIAVKDAAMAAGSTTLTSASAAFTAAMVGWTVSIDLTDSGTPRQGTIVSYVSPTEVTLSVDNNSGGSVAGRTLQLVGRAQGRTVQQNRSGWTHRTNVNDQFPAGSAAVGASTGPSSRYAKAGEIGTRLGIGYDGFGFADGSSSEWEFTARRTAPNKMVWDAASGAVDQTFGRRYVDGTQPVAADFALSAGWGTGAAISGVNGKDAAFFFTVTAGNASLAANPTITYTFKDGAWPLSPIVTVAKQSGTGVLGFSWSPTTSTLVITLTGTPVASSTYTFVVRVEGR